MKELKVQIVSAGNTAAPCFYAIESKGYKVKISSCLRQVPYKRISYQYDAYKKDEFFSASSPEELLGLIHMWEIRGDSWRVSKSEAHKYGEYVDNSPLYDEDGNLLKDD
ncbi:hypothetical protein EKN56_15835 [Limnobaculum zhutongyuii]|uniref:Uncharacterized protein n=1 Tax=Limnobaculum zhutongyuii TaxID=2498113 RepID=A0A411WND7_9GAMM|nr:hypothetical protein [Limnobaculum zhutongyuii]QBH97743.1 hypothetical protein EKN56_15835 [Limnobaculum zhutongyuii]TQS87966.1 hypothetical protein ELQ32_13005 [Limnobaculum zhutongyuii]